MFIVTTFDKSTPSFHIWLDDVNKYIESNQIPLPPVVDSVLSFMKLIKWLPKEEEPEIEEEVDNSSSEDDDYDD